MEEDGSDSDQMKCRKSNSFHWERELIDDSPWTNFFEASLQESDKKINMFLMQRTIRIDKAFNQNLSP
jgi:hypothetical protein